MKKKCFVEDCVEPIEVLCLCNSAGMCSGHLQIHQRAQGVHQYFSVVTSPHQAGVELLTEMLLEHHSYLTLIKKKIYSEAQILIKEIWKVSEEIIKKIEKLEISLVESIGSLARGKNRDSQLDDYLHGLTFLSIEEIKNEIMKAWSFPVLNPETRKLLSQLSTLFKLEQTSLPYSIEEQKFLYFFADNSTILSSINIKSQTLQNFRLPLKSERGAAGILCFLPSQRMFYGGGQVKNKTISQYIIIDETSGQITEIKAGPEKKRAGSCYLADYVYLFGGCHGDMALKSCERFEVNKCRWEPLADLPLSSDTSAAILNGQIFVAGGRIDSVFQYLPGHRKFVSILNALDLGNKFLCSALGKLFLFHEDQVLISSYSNPYEWTQRPTHLKLGKLWISAWVFHENSIYFTTGHYQCFEPTWPKARKFNLKTLELSDII